MLSVDIAGQLGRLGLSVQFEAGVGVTALVGLSGAGKSTILRAIAGLWTPHQGTVTIGSKTLLDVAAAINIPPHRRRIGAVFQRALLFPHMSIERNLSYGIPNESSNHELEAIVELLDISPLLNRMPRNLSAGEAQRVSIGRALLSSPDILLLDEPMTGLDEDRRSTVLPYLLSLREKLTIPILYVTHRSDEVAQIAHSVVQISNGHSQEALTIDRYIELTGNPVSTQS